MLVIPVKHRIYVLASIGVDQSKIALSGSLWLFRAIDDYISTRI